MSYCTQSDLIARFGETELIQLTDRTNSGAINATVLDQAMVDAGAEIDGYLSGQYSLPLATIPANLTRLCCDMTRYRLYDQSRPDPVNERYVSAIRYLELVARGQIGLGPSVAGTLTSPDASGITMSAGAAVFGRDAYDGF